LSDLVCVMREGKIIQSGTPSQVYAKPQTMYVAEFIGKPRMSMLHGALEAVEGGVAFVREGLRIELGSPAELGVATGTWPDVAFGVRAEDVLVHPNGGVTERATIPAIVGLMEPIGSDTFVELDVGGQTIVARVSPDLPLALGQSVSAELRRSGIHLFARATGERIVA
jgi:multiple sugar transport system ATP-binding protein